MQAAIETSTPSTLDTAALEAKVKAMYRRVAEQPDGDFHFEMGRAMAERLGYPRAELDRVPPEAIASFAGVGHHFDFAALCGGERVLDLGSGSGLDSFVAALQVGSSGRVVGIDMCDAQRDKAAALAGDYGFGNVRYLPGHIEALPSADASFDCVISNGVINLSADKAAVFAEAARVLRPGGRLALSDIVTQVQLPEGIVCDATLWAACIGGAMQREAYQQLIEDAGLRVHVVKVNHGYRFLSDNARGAERRFGVQSISLVAIKA
jgi:SAM-dependent methyltransferase